MQLTVSKENLEQKIKEANKNTYVAYEVAEYYYMLANYKKAVEWYEKAAFGTPVVPMALYAMGYACQNGEGTAVDLFRAAEFYEAAAEKDIPQACYNLAFFYQNGIGVCRDLNRANRYCERAAESLKRLVDSLQEAQMDLQRSKLSHTQLINSVLENEKKWMSVCNELSQKSKLLGETECKIANLEKQILDLSASVLQREKEIEIKKQEIDRLTSIHCDTLRVIDELNADVRKLNIQIDSLNNRYTEEAEKSSTLLGENRQLKKEKEDIIVLQEKINKDIQLEQQKYYDLLGKNTLLSHDFDNVNDKLNTVNQELTTTKKQRNALAVSAVVLIIVIIMIILL